MEIKVNAREFGTALDKVKTVCPKKTVAMTLQRIYIKATDNEMVCYATDLEQFLEVKVDAIIIEPGECGIDINDLKVISKANDEITLKTEDENKKGKRIKVQFGKKTVYVNDYVLDEEERFKTPENDTETEILEAESDWLYESIIKLATFASTDECNKIFCTINFNTKENRMESLDRRRVGIRQIPDGMVKGVDDNCMLHIMCIKPMKKVIDKKSKDKIAVFKGNKYIKIVGEDFTYYQRIVDGRYYNLSLILQSQAEKVWTMTIDTKELKEIMKYNFGLIEKDDLRPVVFYVGNGQARTYFINKKYETKDELEVKEIEGDGILGVNPGYVVDALDCVESEEVEMYGTTSKAPMFVAAEDYLFLILPVHINEEMMKEKLVA